MSLATEYAKKYRVKIRSSDGGGWIERFRLARNAKAYVEYVNADPVHCRAGVSAEYLGPDPILLKVAA